MNRRHFLTVLSAGATGFVLDPERLLWRPGAKTFFLPSAQFEAIAQLEPMPFLEYVDAEALARAYVDPYVLGLRRLGPIEIKIDWNARVVVRDEK